MKKFNGSVSVWMIMLAEYVLFISLKDIPILLAILTMLSAIIFIIVTTFYLYYETKRIGLLILAFFEVVGVTMHVCMCIITLLGYASARPIGWWVISLFLSIGIWAVIKKAKTEAKI